MGLKAKEQAVIEKERAQVAQTKSGTELCVVAQPGMRVQRQMRTIYCQVTLEQEPHQLVALSRPRMSRSPKEAVMNDQQVRTSRRG